MNNNKWWALAAVGSGVFMSTVDGSIVNIALVTLQNYFRAGLHEVEWVVLAYLLGITCLLPSMGRLGDMIGKRRVYVAGFVVFTVSSALCGAAWSVQSLVLFRVLQAIGAAMIQSLGPALLVTAFPAKERGQALGYIGTIVAAGILTGPVLGGLLLRSKTTAGARRSASTSAGRCCWPAGCCWCCWRSPRARCGASPIGKRSPAWCWAWPDWWHSWHGSGASRRR
jgi:MFS family permease